MKIITVLVAFTLTILILSVALGKRKTQFVDSPNNVAPMPWVPEDVPEDPIVKQNTPVAQQDEKYNRYLASTVKIKNHGIGSGTMIYYDPETREVYVSSCGHLWSGIKNYTELRQSPEYCQITVFYADRKLLSTPKKYTARVLFRQFQWGQDVSLLKFTADFEPQTFPIAPINYDIKLETTYHSTGCDNSSDPAHYGVEVIGIEQDMLTTRYNSPRPGRSGGGLLTSDGYYIGICVATSDRTGQGRGRGYFTQLSTIHKIYTQNGFAGLLSLSPKRFR
jgi:hypothetical protein